MPRKSPTAEKNEPAKNSPAKNSAEKKGACIRTYLRVMLDEEIAMGPGKADLLEAIRDTGSISAAGKKLGMSYRRAWLLVDTMNRCFRAPIVETSAGGTAGGGAVLSAAGIELLERYRTLETAVAKITEKNFAEIKPLLRKSALPQS